MSETRRPKTAIQSMWTYMTKAVRAREDYYHGMDEAAGQWLDQSRTYTAGLSVEDAKYRWSESRQAKQLVADNNWHMRQAMMFGVAAIAVATENLLIEQRRTNELLKSLLEK